MTLVLFLAGIALVLASVRSLADLIGPIFLALVITVTLHPIRIWLERLRLPEWAASFVMLVGCLPAARRCSPWR